MTRDRVWGEDSDFSAWVRSNPLLPSSEIVATDADLWIHRYKTHIDSVGEREIQSIIMIEAKTRNAKPNSSQQDTLLKIHRTIVSHRRFIKVKKELVKNFGVAILSMSGATIDSSDQMQWGRFCEKDFIEWKPIDKDILTELLSFDRNPDTFEINPFRRRHLKSTFEQLITFPLGFSSPVTITTQS